MVDKSDRVSRDVSIQMTFEGRGSFSATGPADLVFEALSDFRTELATGPDAPAGAKIGKAAEEVEVSSPPPATPKQKAAHQDESVGPLPPFHDKRKPRSNAEAIAVFAVWAKRRHGTETFTPQSVLDLWRTTSRKTPGRNLGRDIANAVKKGWLEPAGKGQYKVGGYAEGFVDKLPERGS